MPLQLALGQVDDPDARRAFEQIALRWPLADPAGMARVSGQVGMAISASAWTVVPLTGALTQRGSTARIAPDPASGGVKVLASGLYTVTGAVIWSPAQQTGERGVQVTHPRLANGGVANGCPMIKGTPLPQTASGEGLFVAGDIVTLQVWSDTATSIRAVTPDDAWLSMSWLGAIS